VSNVKPAHARKPAPFDAREPACCQTVFEKVVAEDGNEEERIATTTSSDRHSQKILNEMLNKI
jgi:hypothetical protein